MEHYENNLAQAEVLIWDNELVTDKYIDSVISMREIFENNKDDEKFRDFLCENTPWFLGGAATCIIDLPNIE